MRELIVFGRLAQGSAFFLFAPCLPEMHCLPVLSDVDPLTLSEAAEEALRDAQERLARFGFYSGRVDGIFGSKTATAVIQFQKSRRLAIDGVVGPQTWSALYDVEADEQGRLPHEDKVSADFVLEVRGMCERLDIDPTWLMAVMAFETGGSFFPDVQNAASGATGLIQFLGSTAKGLGTSTDELAAMTAVEQLAYVEKYLEPYAGRVRTLEDLYCAVLWPAAIGRPAGYALFRRPSLAYEQNRGLDRDRDGVVTKWEAAEKVREQLSIGFRTADGR